MLRCSSYVRDLVKQKMKFIIFAYHMSMMDALSDKLKHLKANYIRIDGTTKQELRSAYIDRFQNEKSCQVAVLSLKGMHFMLRIVRVAKPICQMFISRFSL